MDIPKQTSPPAQTASVSIEPAARREGVISDINTLNLQPGKQYAARVILTQQMQTAGSGSQSEATPAKSMDSANMPGGTSETKSGVIKLQTNEYLLRLNAKTILITSEKSLNAGDKLLLALDPHASSGKPSLLARPAGAEQPILSATPGSATAGAGSIAPAGQTLQNSVSLNTQQIHQLLQALNLTLDKQIPLQAGFRQISSLLTELPASEMKSSTQTVGQQASTLTTLTDASEKISPILRQLTQQQLISSLTRSTDILNTHTTGNHNKPLSGSPTTVATEGASATTSNFSSGTAASAVKSALLNSGLFLENNLLGQPDKLLAFKAQLESLTTSMARINQEGDTLRPDNPAPLQRFGNSLNKIQQTIEMLLHNTSRSSHSHATTQTALTPGEHNPSLSDLKASLVSVASLLARQLNREASAEAIKNLFLLPITEDYAHSPFAFPLLAANKPSTAKSLFEKQEFTTGQLLKLLAGMIHRLQFNQLHSLLHSNSNTDAPSQQSWFFELPVINHQQQVHTFNFRIDKEPQPGSHQASEEDKGIQWKLLLSFDLDELGPIYVQVKFLEHVAATTPTISSVLWADKAETLSLLQNEAAQFRKSLESLGLQVTEVRCEKGQPNQTGTRLDRHLVDTRA